MTFASPPALIFDYCLWVDYTAHGMSSWSTDTFKAHVGDSILKQLWNDHHHGDFEIRCGDKKMKVHRAILRSHSDVLANICDNRSFKEAVSGILNLKSHPYKGNLDNLGDGDDPEIVEEMVHYFYHLELSPKAQFKPQTWECEVIRIETSLAYLARIYVLAEKYFIEGLRAVVITSFRESLDRELEHHELIEACHIIFKKTVEQSDEKDLKATVATCLALQLEKVKKSEMHDRLFQEIPELAFRVLKEVPKPRSPTSHHCGRCGSRDISW